MAGAIGVKPRQFPALSGLVGVIIKCVLPRGIYKHRCVAVVKCEAVTSDFVLTGQVQAQEGEEVHRVRHCEEADGESSLPGVGGVG